MKAIASCIAGSAVASILMMGCTVNQPPDVVETPGHTTVIHEHASTPSINITPPSSTHTETNTTTTVPSPDAPDGSSTTQTSTTTTGG